MTVFNGPAVALAFAPASIAPGEISTLTITLSNRDGATATGVGFNQSLPAGLSVAAQGASTCGGTFTASATTVSLTGGNIAANGACTMTLDVTSTTTGTFNWSLAAAAITTANIGPNADSAAATLAVGTFAPPLVTVAVAPESIARGTAARLSIQLTNANSAPIEGIRSRRSSVPPRL